MEYQVTNVSEAHQGLNLVMNGGRCCGAKHIHGFGPPTYILSAIPEDVSAASQNFHDDHNYSAQNFFPGPAPAEKYVERLDRLLAHLDEKRPHHMVEAILQSWQRQQWKELLEKRGFKEVAHWKNSNTGNTLYLFVRTK